MALLGVPFVKGSAESGTKIREKKTKLSDVAISEGTVTIKPQ